MKIDPADLPQRPNLHYLGGKSYEQLPAYLGGWDVALIPFAINDAKGRWRVQVRDVISGLTAATSITRA